ncbi:MAG: hypothetical protein HKN47_22255 [Pirellulaceae bacterium]|nr:hypothetical protein [Pirellulaceae bacterium]
MAFVAVCIYFFSCIVTALALSWGVDGTLPTSTPFGPETLGFNGIMIGLAMTPEFFFMVPHAAGLRKRDADASLIPFRFGISPANGLFLAALAIGVIQSVFVFFLWRGTTTATQVDFANIGSGVVTFVLVMVSGVLLAAIAGNASALQQAIDGRDDRRRKR